MERKKPMGKRVTLADIAKVAGVTPATVQRALKGLEGVGDEQRQNILRVAKEMNYRPNVLASTLKKGEVNIAIVLPDAEDENQYYAASLWDGVQAVLDGSYGYMVKGHRFSYERSPKTLGETMQRVCAEMGGQLNGVITMGVEDEAFLDACRQLDSRLSGSRWSQRRLFQAFPHLHAGRYQEAMEKLREYRKSRH